MAIVMISFGPGLWGSTIGKGFLVFLGGTRFLVLLGLVLAVIFFLIGVFYALIVVSNVCFFSRCVGRTMAFRAAFLVALGVGFVTTSGGGSLFDIYIEEAAKEAAAFD